MSTFFEFFTFRLCPKCKFEWKRKYVKDENTQQLNVEYSNVHKREEINKITKVQYFIFRCLRCFTEIAESHQMITEEEFKEMNKIKIDSKIKPIVIENIDPTKLLNDDDLSKLIGM